LVFSSNFVDDLLNISPVDGRYGEVTEPLRMVFSEQALMRYRVLVEVDYFIALCKIPLPQLRDIPPGGLEKIRKIAAGFSNADAQRIKQIEQTTRHDIKAVEYFIRERFDELGLGSYKEFVHFGLTSQDVNNTAMPMMLKQAMESVLYPALEELLDTLRELSNKWLHIPMLAHTHGQPASPTTMGKEIMVFYERLNIRRQDLKGIPFPAKFGGATGNFNAHHICYPEIDWVSFANEFCISLGLKRSQITTQIDHYDGLAALFDGMKRLCTILLDLDRDFWTYISMDYFKQKIVDGEVGSSAMPHKVNPIDFENAEGNAGIAIALFEHLSAKLPVSRLQRDLSDSTVLRNTGLPLGHMLIALKATRRGLVKISLHEEKIHRDLEDNMVVVAEAIQHLLRTLGYPDPYRALKALTRKNKPVTKETLHQFIDQLDIDQEQKEKLKRINPFNYTGIIPKPIE